MSDQLRIGVIFPQVLGTYGDTGNGVILAERARRRGFPADIVSVGLSDPIPSTLDLYVLGGGEDTAQAIAASRMRSHTGLRRAAEKGTPILAICASLQVLGTQYTDAEGRLVEGLGLLDVTTVPRGARAIGEVVEQPLIEGLTEVLTGFENHGGATILGPDASPLGQVLVGIGNGAGDDGAEPRFEGAVQGSVIGSYLHGPVLARNPQLADYLLTRALGVDLAELQVPGVERLRAERLAAADRKKDAA